ncbi:MAG: hypothetical protein JRE64_16545 [Deltaproteobacteria bacterium]|nr:hypothetical protein [Deltaproteobacteria bacterium]
MKSILGFGANALRFITSDKYGTKSAQAPRKSVEQIKTQSDVSISWYPFYRWINHNPQTPQLAQFVMATS